MSKLVEFMDRPRTVKKARRLFLLILFLLLVTDPLVDKHAYFFWEEIPCFYAVYGFIACALIIGVSKTIGKLWLQKGEDYYE